jgi:hypothetical protein
MHTLLSLACVIAIVAAASSETAQCNGIVDPINYTRSGLDYASIPLSHNASLNDCMSLCCNATLCMAFSYNNPQPMDSCVNGECCKQGGVCCMLKNGVPPLTNNTYGPAVATGTVPPSPMPPGPTPPFPLSTLILNVSFGAPSHWTGGTGDTWPTAVAADGSLYGWECDNNLVSRKSASHYSVDCEAI